MHNYMRVWKDNNEVLIGSEEYPLENWITAWSLLSQEFSHHSGLGGYGIMNEPHDLENIDWINSAQASIYAIRNNDQETPIVISGDSWSSAVRWRNENEALIELIDPSDLLIFEGHWYLDKDQSGTYTCMTPEECGVDATTVTDQINGFTTWCHENEVQCWIGEFGVPVDHEEWRPIVEEILNYTSENQIGVAFWAAGPWWGGYALSLEKTSAQWLIHLINR